MTLIKPHSLTDSKFIYYDLFGNMFCNTATEIGACFYCDW